MAKEILRRVVMDTITDYILDRLEGILTDKDPMAGTIYTLLAGWSINHFKNHVDIYSENRFIQNESRLGKNIIQYFESRGKFSSECMHIIMLMH